MVQIVYTMNGGNTTNHSQQQATNYLSIQTHTTNDRINERKTKCEKGPYVCINTR